MLGESPRVLQLVPNRAKPALPPSFRDLRVRPKLIVLHNAFFLVLTVAVYYSLIPLVEEHVQSVQQRESALLGELLLEQQRPLPLGDIQPEDRRFGSA
jgi:heme exporter protein D